MLYQSVPTCVLFRIQLGGVRLYLESAVPVLDPFLERPLKGAKGHRLRHGDVLVEERHVVVYALQDARACRKRTNQTACIAKHLIMSQKPRSKQLHQAVQSLLAPGSFLVFSDVQTITLGVS